MTRWNAFRTIPFSIEPARRVECLLSIAQQFYHQGQSVFSGVEPAALAVMVAADLGDAALHRKSLTFQGIILSIRQTIQATPCYRWQTRCVWPKA